MAAVFNYEIDVQRLRQNDSTLTKLYLGGNQISDQEKMEFIDERLLQNQKTRPNRVATLYDLFIRKFGNDL